MRPESDVSNHLINGCGLVIGRAVWPRTTGDGACGCCPRRGVRDGGRIERAQQGQPAPVRADRERAEDRQEPDGLGLPAADRVPQGGRPAGAGPVAAAPAAPARPRGGVDAGRGRRPERPAATPSRARTDAGGHVYPSRFRYEAPRSIDEAIALLEEGAGEAKVLAGGQSLVPLLKLRFAAPELLVDINNLPGLDYHRVDPDGTIRVGALCRHAELERSTHPGHPAADHGRGRPAHRRPDRAQPRHAGRLAVPRRPAGRLGLGGHRARWLRRRAGRERAAATSRSTEFVTGPFQNALAYDEIAVEAVIPAPKGTVAGGYLKLERRVGDFATAGHRGRARAVRRGRHPGRHRADRRRRLDHQRRRRRARRWSAARSPPTASGTPPTWRRRPPSRGPTTGAARATSGTSCAPSSSAS